MVSRELIAALSEARRVMSSVNWQKLVTQIGELEGTATPVSIPRATAGLLNRDAAWILAEAFRQSAKAVHHGSNQAEESQTDGAVGLSGVCRRWRQVGSAAMN